MNSNSSSVDEKAISMLASTRYLFLLLLLLVLGISPLAQPFHPHFRQFNTDEGLPSSEVHYVLQDQKGYLWFATDNGVARFDGFEFEIFDSEDGLEDVVVFRIHEDEQGHVWIGTYSGLVYYFDGQSWHPFEHNDKILELSRTAVFTSLEGIDKDRGVLIGATNIFNRFDEFIYFNWDGQIENLTPARSSQLVRTNYFIAETGNSQVNIDQPDSHFFSGYDSLKKQTELWNYKTAAGEWKLFLTLEGKHTPKTIIALSTESNRQYLLFTNLGQYKISEGNIEEQWDNHSYYLNHIFRDKQDSRFLCALNVGGGLERIQLRQNGEIQRDTILQGHSISRGIFDQQGGLWLTSLDAGVFYAPIPEIPTYSVPQLLPAIKAKSVSVVNDSILYGGFQNGEIYRVNYQQSTSEQIDIQGLPLSGEVNSMSFDSTLNILFANFFYLKNASAQDANKREIKMYRYGKKDQSYSINLSRPISSYERTNRKILFASGYVFGSYNLEQEEFDLLINTKDLLAAPRNLRAYFKDKQGNHWLGTLFGLYQYIPSQQKLVANDLNLPELRQRVEIIKGTKDGAILFGTRGNGLIFYNQDTTYSIRKSDGLASDMIRNIHITDHEVVWVGTLSGISKILFNSKGEISEIRTFTTSNGLPNNEVFDIDSRGNKIWLATSVGIHYFIEPPENIPSPAPYLHRIKVNGKEEQISSLKQLATRENIIEITFRSIDYRMGDNINYRYRLNSDLAWQYTNFGTVTFPDLSPGQYTFEVQSQNRQGDWSTSTLLDIQIAQPWYLRWQTFVLGSAILVFGVTTFFYFRDRALRKEQAILQQMDHLERSAIHAQMNPHFVFNSLNSIQHFIVQNDTKQAVFYLAQFAQLIRDTLRVSVEGKHHLEEEISMLKNYISLEKLRFKEGFEYEIKVEDNLDLTKIFIPPLLIQPFVENAIKHGLQGRKEGGMVEVIFGGDPKELKVTIKDNGIGINPEQEIKEGSLGMDITRRRLEMMQNKNLPKGPMEVKPLYALDGQIVGTEININISPVS